MPHIVVEHTNAAEYETDNIALLQDIHDAAMATGLFSEKAIKVRVKTYDAAMIAGKIGILPMSLFT